MNSAQDPKSSQPAESERVQFLLSRQLDGDLTLDESSELTTLLQADAFRAWLAAATNLRSHLKALPVQPVSESFASSVRDAVHQSSNMTVTAPARDRRRGWILRGIVAVTVTACSAALLLFLRPPLEMTRQVADAGNRPAAETMMGIPQTDAAAPVSTESEAITPQPTLAESNVLVQQEQMRVFIENDDWDIVVVQVHSKDRDTVMRGIETLLAENGMDIQPVAGNKVQDARFGILLTSTSVRNNAFINSVLSETDAESADWDAQSVADSTRESLIHSVQESLKFPTHSELHFGQVYMTLPKASQPAVAVSQPRAAQNDTVSGTSDPAGRTEKGSAPTEASRASSAVRTTPVFVVFEFTDEPPAHL